MIIVFENFFLVKLSACLMDPETAVTWTCGHFNQVIFAVYSISFALTTSLMWPNPSASGIAASNCKLEQYTV